jgi:hypothetical protein
MNAKKSVSTVWVVVLLSATALLSAADNDGDGVDDAVDVCCETPPNVEVDELGRPVGDMDGDCDVDLHDFSYIQSNLTGPIPVGCCFDGDCRDDDPCTVDSCDEKSSTCSFDPVPNCGVCEIGPGCNVEADCDVPVPGSISSATETDTICFCVTNGEIIRIAVSEVVGSGANFNPNWRLLDGAGNAAPVCGVFTTTVAQDCGPLPAAGNPYQIEVEDGSRNDVGSYIAYFHRLSAVAACEAASVQCDVPLSGTVSSAVDADLIEFDAVEGGIMRISVVEQPGGGANFAPSWRVIDRAGNPARDCGAFGAAFQDCGPLSPRGNPYRIEIEDGGRNDIGGYAVHVQQLAAGPACDFAPLICDVPLTATINPAADSDLLGFRVVEGEIVRISLVENVGSSANFGPSWRLLDGEGAPALFCGAFSATVSVNCGPLPSAGNPYRIEVEDGARNDTGTYNAHLQRLTASRACGDVEPQCGVTHADTIEHIADSDLYAYHVEEGDSIRVGVFERVPSGTNFNPNWRLLDGAGNPAPVCGAFTTVTSVDCGPLPAARNPYRVEVEDGTRNDTGNYDVTVSLIPACPP